MWQQCIENLKPSTINCLAYHRDFNKSNTFSIQSCHKSKSIVGDCFNKNATASRQEKSHSNQAYCCPVGKTWERDSKPACYFFHLQSVYFFNAHVQTKSSVK